jgi:Rieske Fe-S protein
VKVRPIGPKRDLNEMKKDVEVQEALGIKLSDSFPSDNVPCTICGHIGCSPRKCRSAALEAMSCFVVPLPRSLLNTIGSVKKEV